MNRFTPALRDTSIAIIGGALLAGSASPMLVRADEYSPVEDTLITYVPAASAIDECGVENDAWFIPENVDYVYFEQDELVWGDERVDGVGSVTIVAYPVEGYTFPEGLETSWTFYFTDDTCPEPTPSVEPIPEPTVEPPTEVQTPTETVGALIPADNIEAPPTLASTGGEFNWLALFLGGLAVVFGSALSYREWKKVTR